MFIGDPEPRPFAPEGRDQAFYLVDIAQAWAAVGLTWSLQPCRVCGIRLMRLLIKNGITGWSGEP